MERGLSRTLPFGPLRYNNINPTDHIITMTWVPFKSLCCPLEGADPQGRALHFEFSFSGLTFSNGLNSAADFEWWRRKWRYIAVIPAKVSMNQLLHGLQFCAYHEPLTVKIDVKRKYFSAEVHCSEKIKARLSLINGTVPIFHYCDWHVFDRDMFNQSFPRHRY